MGARSCRVGSPGAATGRTGPLRGHLDWRAGRWGADEADAGGRGGDKPLTPHRSNVKLCPVDDNLIPLADLVTVFHRSKSTLYRWAESNQIPTRRIGSTIYMHKDDVARYTSNRKGIDEELDRRRQTHGRILDAETATLIISKLEDALVALRTALRGDR